MNRILVWYVDTLVDDQYSLGPVFYMDRDYRPRVIRVHAKRAPGMDMSFDIRVDGTSIMGGDLPVLGKGDTLEDVAQDFVVPEDTSTIAKDSIVTFHLVSGGTSGITVQLELESETDESEFNDDLHT
jgi:hypothetical protein